MSAEAASVYCEVVLVVVDRVVVDGLVGLVGAVGRCQLGVGGLEICGFLVGGLFVGGLLNGGFVAGLLGADATRQ